MENSYFDDIDDEAPESRKAIEIEKVIQALPTDLALDLSQNLYYGAGKKKLNDETIKAQLRQWLFERFPTENPTLKNFRDAVATKVLSALNALQKQLPKEEPMPKKWHEFNDVRIILLTAAIIKVSAETVVKGDDNSEFKLKMLRSFLNIDSTS